MLYCYDILGRVEGEQVMFRYYSAAKKQVFVSEQTFAVGKRASVVGAADQPLSLTFVPQGSMTAYLTLDALTAGYADKTGDRLAAFLGNVCAGVGELVGEQDGRLVYKMVVNGVSSQAASVDIRYYSHRNSYVFTGSCMPRLRRRQGGGFARAAAHPASRSRRQASAQDDSLRGIASEHRTPGNGDDLMAAFVGANVAAWQRQNRRRTASMSSAWR